MVDNIKCSKGSETVYLTEKLFVEGDVHVSVVLRSIGKKKSQAYVAVICFDKDNKEIRSFHNNRIEDAVGIKNILNNGDQTIFTLLRDVVKWFGKNSLGYQRGLGIYLDGDISKRPDYIIHFESDSGKKDEDGAYHFIEPNQIKLNKKLDQEILDSIEKNISTLVIMNHYSTSTYLYNALSNGTVPNEWTTYSFKYTGESFNDKNLRIGTCYVQLLILANYKQNLDAELLIKNQSLYTYKCINYAKNI